ncbi:MAG: hypothetical protein K2O67_06845 [Clostridia bacterium]|nr:hypothetical protein [Clostridia bacterium]
MKKFLVFLATLVLCIACAFGVAGCNNKGSAEGVTLVEVSSDDVGRVDGVAYYVVPEPAATAKVKALTAAGTEYTSVASLQQLYGEESYPQAVLVAKKSLIENDGAFVNKFLTEYAGTANWLDVQTSYADIVTAINSHGGTTLKAPMLSSVVVKNCNIYFKKAADAKQGILSYMNSVNAINSAMFGQCDDAFFCDVDSISATTVDESKTTVSVYMPDGAPALSMAKMMCVSPDVGKTLDFHVVAANTINTCVTYNDEANNADLCVLPVNAAAKLLGNGSKYQLLGGVTHGNLFIISSDGTPLTADNLSQKLEGKRVGVVNLSAVPGLTFKMILKKYDITYTQGGV